MQRRPEYCRTLQPGDSLDEAVAEISEALRQGHAVTVCTHEATLTTQEAADVLGVSRPTVVRLLEHGQIPYEQPGRHRRVRLADVLEFQRSHRYAAPSSRPVDAGRGAGR
ncbi:MAG: helix-turn-helix domain-containing protein [Actinomycetes bacterium]